LGTDTHGAKCFQGHWKEIVCPAERAVLCCPSGSCTGTGDGALLEIGVPQSVDYCDVSSGAASGVPRQQRSDVVFCWSFACKTKRECLGCRRWHHTGEHVHRKGRTHYLVKSYLKLNKVKIKGTRLQCILFYFQLSTFHVFNLVTGCKT